jgi:uncharacterized membrane protein
MNLLNLRNILGQETSIITIVIAYLLPFFIVVVVYFIDKKNTLSIFLFSLFLFLTLTYILYSSMPYANLDLSRPFKNLGEGSPNYYASTNNATAQYGGDIRKMADEFSSSLSGISDSVKEQLSNPLCFPLNLAQILVIFGYLLLSLTLVFNTNKKNKNKYFFFNTIIQYSLFYNFLFIMMTSHQIKP